MTKSTVIAQDWFLYLLHGSLVLFGVCYNHPKIEDGHHFQSSVVTEIRDGEVETLNTFYQVIGKPLEVLPEYWIKKGAKQELVCKIDIKN